MTTRLDEFRALLANVTPGEWWPEQRRNGLCEIYAALDGMWVADVDLAANAAFIAQAPAIVRELLEVVEAMQTLADDLEAEFRACGDPSFREHSEQALNALQGLKRETG